MTDRGTFACDRRGCCWKLVHQNPTFRLPTSVWSLAIRPVEGTLRPTSPVRYQSSASEQSQCVCSPDGLGSDNDLFERRLAYPKVKRSTLEHDK